MEALTAWCIGKDKIRLLADCYSIEHECNIPVEAIHFEGTTHTFHDLEELECLKNIRHWNLKRTAFPDIGSFTYCVPTYFLFSY
jgi:hypothetical protein